MLSKKSFVTICLSKLLSCAGDFSKDFGHSWQNLCMLYIIRPANTRSMCLKKIISDHLLKRVVFTIW